MEFNVEEIKYLSSNKENEIYAKIYTPKNVEKVEGIIQISHGMCEYIEKYEEFIKYMLDKGYIVCGNNHLGHGKKVEKEKRGFFADSDGYKYMVEDLHLFTKIVKDKFPNIPYFIFGHSMGSFIARIYISKYAKEIDGAIIMGTGTLNKLVPAGIKLADVIIARKGKMYRSKMLTNMVIGEFNKKFKPNKSKYDWLSSDESMLPVYENDKIGDFIFTVSGYKDLFNLNILANDIKTFEKTPKELPIFILSGNDDPVGDSGVGVLEVYHNYINTEHEKVKVKLYPKLRHELLNEVCRNNVYDDIIDWIRNI